jgi:EpsI family protein
MKSSWRVAILVALLLTGGALVNAWEFLGEARVDRTELKEFPKQLGAWEQSNADQQLDGETIKVLRATDYLIRDYRGSNQRVASLYIGYFATQRNGATYHSPLNCLPGSGWIMTDGGTITITPRGRPAFVANRYLIRNGDYKSALIYWYQGRGRAVSSEYWGKIYTVVDSVRMRRSDGAMVRVTTSVTTSEDAAFQAAADLAANAAAVLPAYIPD